MEKSIYNALAAFQAEAPMILKTANNPFYKSKYADLPAVWGTIKELVTKHGFVVLNSVVQKDGRDCLETTLFYPASGELLTSCLPINPAKNDPQGYGAAITYHRRQNLVTLLGLVCDDDDDGNAASGKEEKPKPENKPKPKEEPNPKTPQVEFLETCRRELEALNDIQHVTEWQQLPKVREGMKDLNLKQVTWLQDQINAAMTRLNPLNAG